MRTLPVLAALVLLFSGTALGATDNAWSTRDYDLYPGDFNGDGLDDLLYVAKAADKPSGIALSDGKAPNISQQTWFGNFLGITWFGNYYKPIVADYNGDGCDDILMHRQTPGDHYLILTDCAKYRIRAISQTIPNKYLGQIWSADAHRVLAGDFNGDGRSDLLLQGANAATKHSIYLSDSTGLFTQKPQQTWTDGYLGFGWSIARAELWIGDYDGDGLDDVFVQARPDFATINYDVTFQVPFWQPGAFGILLAKPADASGAIFQLSSIQQTWDANYLGALWSPILSNVLVADFNGDGRDDILLQAKFAGRPTLWLPSNVAAQFMSLMGLAATNINWSAESNRLLAANFNGGTAVGLYLQSTVSTIDNQIADVITGSAVSTTPHSMARLGAVTAQTAVGKSESEFSVDQAGAATYRMPLRLPPGVAGMTPDLSLAYNSRAGNSVLGQKWSLAGLSSISRCPTNWAADGFVDGVDFDSNDKFCIDGQRLLSVSGATYGAVGTEYRTEIQSYQKIVSSGGVAGDPASFTVYTKAGQIIEYGTTTDSRVEAQGKTQALIWSVRRIRDRFNNFITFTYSENTQQSTNRPITITYGGASGTVVGSLSFVYETRTDTTLGYIAGSLVGNDQRLTRIDVYGRPNQAATGAAAASSLVTSYKLTYETSPTSGGSFLVSVAECDSGSGSAQKCLGSSDFVWQHGYRGFSDNISTNLNPGSSNNLRPVDINNDGKLDYVFTNNGTWRYRMSSPGAATINTGLTSRSASTAVFIDWDNDGYMDIAQTGPGSGTNIEVIRGTASGLSTAVTSTTISVTLLGKVGDFDGDGRQDIVSSYPTPTMGRLLLNGPSGLSSGTLSTLQSIAPANYWATPIDMQVADFNGDGRDDLIVVTQDCRNDPVTQTTICNPYVLMTYSFSPATGQLAALAYYQPSTSALPPEALTSVDVNGDGLSDLVFAQDSQWKLLVATGVSNGPTYTFAWSAASATIPQRTDLDWSAFDEGQNGRNYQVEPIKTISLDKARLQSAKPVDYNHDGRTDLLMGGDGYWRALMSNGQSYDTDLATTERPSTNWQSASILDVNSDGLPDIFFPNSAGTDFRVNYGRGPAVSEVIEQISDGLGALTQIQYGVTSDSTIYKGPTAFLDTGAQPAFPYAHLSAPIPVVAKFSADNGRSGGAIYTVYEYSGLKVHKQGRGLLGFAEIKSWNENAAIQTVNQYFQTWPSTGMLWTALQKLPDQVKYSNYLSGDIPPELRLNYAAVCETAPVNCPAITPWAVTTSPGLIVSKTVNTLSQLNDSSGAVFPYVLKSEEYSYPLLASGTTQPAAWKYTKTEYLNAAGTTTSSSYDPYGNPYRIKISVNNGSGGDVHTTDTQNYYTNDATNWILGRLLTAKVTHTRAAYAGSSNTAPVTLTRVSAFTYNSANGVLTSETTEPQSYTDPLSGGSATNGNGTGLWVTKSYGYDTTGNRTSEQVTAISISGGTRTTTTSYDVAGQLPVSVTNSLSQQEQQTWDPRFGVQLTQTGPNGLTTQWQYDTLGRRLMEIAPRSSVWSATDYYWCSLSAYCTDSRAVYAVRKSGSDGTSAISEFDRLGREIRTRKAMMDGREAIQDKFFDPLGRDFRATFPYFLGESPCFTFRKFDVLGRVVSSWRPIADTECTGTPPDYDGSPAIGGQTTSFQYDEVAGGGAGIITTVSTSQANAAARVVTKQTNVMGRLRFLKDVLGATTYVTEYDYDPVGNTTWVKDNAGNQTSLGYDVRGFKASMADPDMGNWTYGYDSLGQLITQTDAKGQVTTLGYDSLGRMTSRSEKVNGTTTESTTNWYYDDLVVGGPKAKGKLTKVVVAANGYAGATGYEEQFVYDSTYGDLQDAKRRIENEWFWISQTYDGLGRVDVIKYPNSVSGSTSSSAGPDGERVKAKQNYNAYGYLSSVSDPDSSTVYWTAVSNDASGALTREDLGNGLSTVRTVGRASGNLTSLTTGVGVSASVQNLTFDWDGAGNLIRRKDNQANKKEEFDYDGLYRMTQSRLFATAGGNTPSVTDNYTYDTIGNLTNKGGTAGAYTYSGYNYGTRTGCSDTIVRPHAVYQVTVGAATRRYCYDANGNLTAQTIASGSGSTKYDSSTWWVANLAKRISQSAGSTYSEFWYGPGRERIRQFAQKSGATTENTLYVGGLYEKVIRTVSGTPTTEYVHYIRGGSQAVAVVKRLSGSLQTRYLHRDHLGSVVALTDTAGAVVERYSYDPWGKRRDPSTWVTPAPGTFSFDPSYMDRGFTGHEHIDQMGLINMNGRIYDPEIGRFLSADPTTQFPESTQGWNRYTYCGNNPLSYTDPSGFSMLGNIIKLVAIAVLSYFTAGLAAYWAFGTLGSITIGTTAANMIGGFAGGFVAGFLGSGGDLKTALVSGAAGALTAGIGSKFSNVSLKEKPMQFFEKAVAHGAVQGAANEALGGDMEDGFLGGFAGSVFEPIAGAVEGKTNSGTLATLTSAIVGGTTSVIGGGKFENGAASAAFVDMFNRRSTGRSARPVATGNDTVDSVTIAYPDGSSETRVGGTRAWRNNNPGNLRMGSAHSIPRLNAIGEAGGFAVFETPEVGRMALISLLYSDSYYSKTIDQAIADFAPSVENNTSAYQDFIRTNIGVGGSTVLSSLTQEQFFGVANAIEKFEGWKAGTVTWKR